MIPTFEQRISNLKSALHAIASHPDFDKVLDSGYWDDETVGLNGAELMIDRLLEAYKLAVKDEQND